MPMDGAGNFRHNFESARMHDRAEGRDPDMQAEEEGGVHGHLKAMHEEMGGKHMHLHHDGEKITSHSIDDSGEVHGPDEHNSAEEAKHAMSKFFDEESEEPEHEGEGEGESEGGLKDLY